MDGIVVGAGPNGLSAGIILARQGLDIQIIEAKETAGGGARSAELTLPGFIHDICSAIHPLAAASPCFRGLPLSDHGLSWIHPPVPLAHPLDDGPPALLCSSITKTSQSLGEGGAGYRRLVEPFVRSWDQLSGEILGPVHLPRHPFLLARFGFHAFRSARAVAFNRLEGKRCRALFAGLCAHSFLPLDQIPSGAFGMVLAILAHVVGWPFPKGGAQKISDALASYFRSLGGQLSLGRPVQSLHHLPESKAILLDVTPRQVLKIAESRLSSWYRRRLERYRYGPGVFKLDWALSEPIPWKDPECRQAGTLHLGGAFEEIAAAEAEMSQNKLPQKPFVILAQQSLFDESRVPSGKQSAWAYAHVPNSSRVDLTEAIESQIERFAPGFRQTILARHKLFPHDLEIYNANYIGGDINGGLQDLRQFVSRPVLSLDPYRTSHPDLFICSASTPPGGGVHGLCGYYSARSALRGVFGVNPPALEPGDAGHEQ